MSCNAYLMRRAYYAGNFGNWEGFEEAHHEISEWAFVKVKESFEKVASEDTDRMRIAKTFFRKKKNTDFLKKNHRACWWRGRCHCIVRVPALSLPSA